MIEVIMARRGLALPGFAVLAALWVHGALAQERPTAEYELPCTADELRVAFAKGCRYRFRTETPGEPTKLVTMDFQPRSQEAFTLHKSCTDEQGKDLEAPETLPVSYEYYAANMALPAKTTVKSEAVVTVPAGTFACKVYTLTLEHSKGVRVVRMSYAKDLPGLFVKLEAFERDPATGNDVVLQTMVLLERRVGE